jgi:hypothetical protein
MNGDFKVKLFRLFMHSLDNLLLNRGYCGNNTSFTEMQRQLAFKTSYLYNYVLKQLPGFANPDPINTVRRTPSTNTNTKPQHSKVRRGPSPTPTLTTITLYSLYHRYCGYFDERLSVADFSASWRIW